MTNEDETEEVRVLAAGPDGQVVAVDKEGNVSVTNPLKHGVPINPESDIVEYGATDRPHVLTRRTIYKGKGPAKVSSPEFRKGWNEVFGKKPKPEELN